MKIINLLQIILIIISVFIVSSKNNLKIILSFSVFSLICAGLYFFLSAPDLALAEAAIGSAIIPFIFLIAISKQRKFLVIRHIDKDDEFLINDGERIGKGYKLLDEFTKHYNLELVINDSKYDELHGIFRIRDVDLVVEKNKKTGKYLLKGKETSILMNKLEQMTKGDKKIKIIKVKEEEMDD